MSLHNHKNVAKPTYLNIYSMIFNYKYTVTIYETQGQANLCLLSIVKTALRFYK